MGAGGSKQEGYTFDADAPVTLSQSVLSTLQSSSETDSSRAQTQELKVQTRVHEELKRIRDDQAKQLDSLTASLTTNPPKEDESSSSALSTTSSLVYHLSSPFYQDTTAKDTSANADSGRSHDSVEKEIMDLKQKLDSRKVLEKVPAEVTKAKENLVQCLRSNDRRPLDCWNEVETFKREVGKLEKAFIQKAGQ